MIVETLLTIYPMVANLAALSPHVAVRFDRRQNQQMPVKTRLIHGLRYSMQNNLWWALIWGAKARMVLLPCRSTRINVHRPILDRLKRCYSYFQQSHIMSQNNSAQQNHTLSSTETVRHNDEQPETELFTNKAFRDSTQAIQTILETDEKLANFPDDHLHKLIKHLGDYQDHCHLMARLADESMVRIESILNSRVGGV